MKKLALLVIFCLTVAGVYAQNSAVNKANSLLTKGDLAAAKEQIDLAVNHEKTLALQSLPTTTDDHLRKGIRAADGSNRSTAGMSVR